MITVFCRLDNDIILPRCYLLARALRVTIQITNGHADNDLCVRMYQMC